MSSYNYFSNGDIIAIVAVIVAIIAIMVSSYIAQNVFRKSTTLQTEMFILDAYKSYMEIAYSDSVSDEYRESAKTQFLMAIDLYCKYVINGHLNKKLSKDNSHFYEEVIHIFKDTIKNDLNGYNNIVDYARKYKIEL